MEKRLEGAEKGRLGAEKRAEAAEKRVADWEGKKAPELEKKAVEAERTQKTKVAEAEKKAEAAVARAEKAEKALAKMTEEERDLAELFLIAKGELDEKENNFRCARYLVDKMTELVWVSPSLTLGPGAGEGWVQTAKLRVDMRGGGESGVEADGDADGEGEPSDGP